MSEMIETSRGGKNYKSFKDMIKLIQSHKKKILKVFNEVVYKKEKYRITCKGIGCYGCCYQAIGTFFCEGLVIAERLFRHGMKDVLIKLIRQGDKQWELFGEQPFGLDPESNKRAFAEWLNRAEPCALFDETSKRCILYGLRPIACASYYVCTDPEICYPPSGQSVLALNNVKVFDCMSEVDRQFMHDMLGFDRGPVALLYPLGTAVCMAAAYLMDESKGLRLSYVEKDLTVNPCGVE